MSINLTHLFLTICKVVKFNVNKVLEANITMFLSRYGLCNFMLLFLGVLGTCIQNCVHIYIYTHKRCGTLEKKLFSTMGYAEIHKQRPFFDNQKDISSIIVLKIQMVSTCFGVIFFTLIFCLLNTIKISFFGGISKFLKLIIFG
jgi:hypothetical protein